MQRCWGRRRVDPAGSESGDDDVSADNIADGDDSSLVSRQAVDQLILSLRDSAGKRTGKEQQLEEFAQVLRRFHGDRANDRTTQAIDKLIRSLRGPATNWEGREQQLEELSQVLQCFCGGEANDRAMKAVDELICLLRDLANNWAGRQQQLEELAQELQRFHGGSAKDRTMQAIDELLYSLRDPASNWTGREQQVEELVQVLQRFHGGRAAECTVQDEPSGDGAPQARAAATESDSTAAEIAAEVDATSAGGAAEVVATLMGAVAEANTIATGAATDEAGPSADEEDDENVVYAGSELADVDLDLNASVSRVEWVLMLDELNIDRDEANNIFTEVAADAAATGIGSAEEGIPLIEFLDEMKIEPDDSESLEVIAKARAAARERLEAGEGEEATGPDLRGLDGAIEAIVRELYLEDRPAEDAWAVCNEGKACLSLAQIGILSGFEGRTDELVEKVNACMTTPPAISSTGGQVACHERCLKEVGCIIEACQAEGCQFTDPEWDMNVAPTSVLYVDGEKPGWDCTVAPPAGFKRLTEIVLEPTLFKDGMQACDIIQGNLGSCFLLGAMGAMASNNEHAMKKVFIKYDISVGVYGVRFNVDGEWRHVVIDDWMPVDGDGQLLYAKCKDPQEVWCPLLEKAYCKLSTCYEMCDGGVPADAFFNLFGGVSGKFPIMEKYKQDPSAYFYMLKAAKTHGYLLTTYFSPQGGGAESGKCGEATFDSGLVGGHCYSVLKLVEAEGEQLLCCRNPWGQGEWMGKWSDRNAEDEWTDEMKNATGYLGHHDGKFWMSIHDFLANSTGVSFARTFGPNWKKITQYKRFQAAAMRATVKFPYQAAANDELGLERGEEVEVSLVSPGWWYGKKDGDDRTGYFPGNYVRLNNRPVARFDLIGIPVDGSDLPVTAVVMVLQPDARMQRKFYARKEDGLNYKNTSYPCFELVILDSEGAIHTKKTAKKRCLWDEIKLQQGGPWRIYVYSVDGLGGKFTVRTYFKDGSATLTEVPNTDIAELIAVIGQ